MASTDTLVLNSGGLHSLIATSLAGERHPPKLLFIYDGRPSARFHHDRFRHQADHFKISTRVELSLTHLFGGRVSADETPVRQPLAWLEALSAAAAVAMQHRVTRIVWPVRVGNDFDKASKITESIVLLQSQAELAGCEPIRIETPFLDMTPLQVVEIGQQLQVPWDLARVCMAEGAEECERCDRCHRRNEAFRQMGIHVAAD